MSDKVNLIQDSTPSVAAFSNPAAPPPYGYSPQYPEKNVQVVTAQPGSVPANRVYYTPPTDNFFVLSIIMTLLCCTCGSSIALCCTIPAIVFSVLARDAESRGDLGEMKTKRRTALVCNIIGFVVGLILTICALLWMYRMYLGWHDGDAEGRDHDDDDHTG